MPGPLISIIVPTYNRAVSLGQTINSVMKQQYENWELVIADDGSSDNTSAVVQRFASLDRRILFLSKDSGSKGAAHCRNIGFQKASGDYVMFLDSDDILLPFCLASRVGVVDKLYADDFIVFPGATFSGDLEKPGCHWNISSDMPDMERFLRFDGPWQTTGALWKRSALMKAGLTWDESLFIWQDIDFHLQALLKGLRYNICWELPPDYLVRSDSADSISRKNYNSPEKINSRLHFWHKYINVFGRLKITEPSSLQQLLLIVLRAAILKKEHSLAAAIMDRALKEQVINKNQFFSLRLNILLSRLTFNRISFPFKRVAAEFKNFEPSVQRVPIRINTQREQ